MLSRLSLSQKGSIKLSWNVWIWDDEKIHRHNNLHKNGTDGIKLRSFSKWLNWEICEKTLNAAAKTASMQMIIALFLSFRATLRSGQCFWCVHSCRSGFGQQWNQKKYIGGFCTSFLLGLGKYLCSKDVFVDWRYRILIRRFPTVECLSLTSCLVLLLISDLYRQT